MTLHINKLLLLWGLLSWGVDGLTRTWTFDPTLIKLLFSLDNDSLKRKGWGRQWGGQINNHILAVYEGKSLSDKKYTHGLYLPWRRLWFDQLHLLWNTCRNLSPTENTTGCGTQWEINSHSTAVVPLSKGELCRILHGCPLVVSHALRQQEGLSTQQRLEAGPHSLWNADTFLVIATYPVSMTYAHLLIRFSIPTIL